MDGQDRAERLTEAIDRLILDGGQPQRQEEDLAPLLSLATALRRSMPPVEARPEFRASLRAQLLAQRRVPRWRRIVGRLVPASPHPNPLPRGEGRGEGRNPRLSWRYAAALAATVLLLVAALLVLGDPFGGRSSRIQALPPAMPSQPSPMAATSEILAKSDGAAAVAPAQKEMAVAAESQPKLARAAEAPASTAEAMVAAPPALMAAPAAQALPALPPLSASFPRPVMPGMGGGLAGPGGEPKREIRFELATSLPDLGSTATVYRYPAPTLDLEWVRSLAAKLGFDPAALRQIGDGDVVAYVTSEQDGSSLEVQLPTGTIVYHASDSGGGARPGERPRPLPSDARAADIATRWLGERDLLPSDVGEPQVSVPFPQASFKEVTFRPAEPSNVVTAYPVVRLDVGADGGALNLFVLWPEARSPLGYPARTAESAWRLLESGRAEMRFEGEHNRPDLDGAVRITSVETGYAITFGQDDQPYLQPVVVFRGESTLVGDPISRPFAAWVPLVADSGLAQPETDSGASP